MIHKNIYSINSTERFADSLVQNIIAKYGGSAQQLTGLLVLVPSKRAAQSVRNSFLQLSEGKSSLLPRIIALADLSYELDAILMSAIAQVSSDDSANKSICDELFELISAPKMSDLHRDMSLAKLIFDEGRAEVASSSNLGNDIFSILSIVDALGIADAMGKLQNELYQNNIEFSDLHNLVSDKELAEHWLYITKFLEKILQKWQRDLEKSSFEDGNVVRDKIIRLLADLWGNIPPDFPVVIAGTTGSLSSTAELMKTVATQEKSMVVLPSTDLEMTDEFWSKIDVSHPQYNLKLLLSEIGFARGDVRRLGGSPHPSPLPEGEGNNGVIAREKLWRNMLLPAKLTHVWYGGNSDEISHDDIKSACKNISYIEADDAEKEAVAIALIMRDALEVEGKTAALVTHDRELARKVRAVLCYYDINIDDSAGEPLLNLPAANFLMLVIELYMNQDEPIALLALLKHPLCMLGGDAKTTREIARDIELNLLRGICVYDDLGELLELAKTRIGEGGNLSDASLSLLQKLYDLLVGFTSNLVSYSPLEEESKRRSRLGGGDSLSASLILKKHIELAENIAAYIDDNGIVCGGSDVMWQKHDGRTLAKTLADAIDSLAIIGDIEPKYYSSLLEKILSNQSYRPPYASHARLHILSPIEARMQSYDVMILASLNEGSWPSSLAVDPWMSREMRGAVGLPLHERLTGQSAHDFAILSMANELVLTRAKKSAGEVTSPSRLLLRLETYLQSADGVFMDMKNRGDKWLSFVNLWLDDGERIFIEPPSPSPPISSRPTSLSATRFERLMRDPYSIYAEKILGLRKLGDIAEMPTVADLGIVIHKALEVFYQKYGVGNQGLSTTELEQELLSIGHECFAKIFFHRNAKIFWWRRFEKIAKWIIAKDFEQNNHGRIRVLTEEKLSKILQDFGDGSTKEFEITAIIDRVDILAGGKANIIDYKTGNVPSKENIKSFVACQMPVNAYLFLQKAKKYEAKFIGIVEYYKLSGSAKKDSEAIDIYVENHHKKPEFDNDEMQKVEAGLRKLINHYNQQNTVYYCCPFPEFAGDEKYNDYLHLARKLEWSG